MVLKNNTSARGPTKWEINYDSLGLYKSSVFKTISETRASYMWKSKNSTMGVDLTPSEENATYFSLMVFNILLLKNVEMCKTPNSRNYFKVKTVFFIIYYFK